MSSKNNTEEGEIISSVNFYKKIKKPSKDRKDSPEMEEIDSKRLHP